MSDEQTQAALPLVEGTIEEQVSEFVRLKAERSALKARIDYLHDRLMEHYDEETAHEAETIEVGRFTIQVVDQARSTIMNRKELSRKYGQDWVKNHTVQTWHRRMNVKPKKRN